MQDYAQSRHARYPQMGSMARTDDYAFADTKPASSPQAASPLGAPTGTQPDFGKWMSAMGGQSSPQKQTAQPDFSQWMRQSQPPGAAPTQSSRTTPDLSGPHRTTAPATPSPQADLSQYMQQATQARRPSPGMPVDFLDHDPSPSPVRPPDLAIPPGYPSPPPPPSLPPGKPTPGREVDYYQQREGDFQQWMQDYLEQENQSRRAFEEWMKGQTGEGEPQPGIFDQETFREIQRIFGGAKNWDGSARNEYWANPEAMTYGSLRDHLDPALREIHFATPESIRRRDDSLRSQYGVTYDQWKDYVQWLDGQLSESGYQRNEFRPVFDDPEFRKIQQLYGAKDAEKNAVSDFFSNPDTMTYESLRDYVHFAEDWYSQNDARPEERAALEAILQKNYGVGYDDFKGHIRWLGDQLRMMQGAQQ